MASQGCSLVEAIHDKYSCQEPLQFVIHVPKSAPGMKDSGDLVLPRQLALNGRAICSAGNTDELKSLCSDIYELDIADNKFHSWIEVFTILECVPGINFLNLSDNPLDACDWILTEMQPVLPNLQKIVLNNTSVSWQSVWELVKNLPNLHELHLSLNELSNVEGPNDEHFIHSNVKDLYLNRTGIDQWQNGFCIVGRALPCLENLVMIGNPIKNLPDHCDILHTAFPCLKSLNVSDTMLDSWEEVEKLKHFPALVNIRLLRLQFLEPLKQKIRRQLLIGYLPRAERLNGSPVGAVEREDAERALIRYYMDRQQKPPRYYELEEFHGTLDRLADVDLSAKDTASVTVHYEGNSFLQIVDLEKSLGDTKKLLAQKFGLKPSQLVVYHNDVGAPYGLEKMLYPARLLRSFGVKEGDELHVDIK